MAINRSTKPEDIIETTQSLRLRIIAKLCGEEGLPEDYVPQDPKELMVLNQTLRDMDAAALTTRKLDVEEKGVDAASKVANNLASIYQQLGGKHPFEIQTEKVQRLDDPSRLPPIDMVPGHTRQGIEELTYEEFVKV